MTISVKHLRKLAKATTQPSPWSVSEEHPNLILDANGFWLADVGPAPKDAAFIAACSPEVVIALLDELATVMQQRDHALSLFDMLIESFAKRATNAAERAGVEQLKRELARQTAPLRGPLFVDDESRCAVCQWPLVDDARLGCVRGNCSQQPRPTNLYAPERAAKEQR